ncbi:MAG: DegT/DnrJ/EryC1/StrS family aminotransferase, partial [Desulfobacteraceae bacterium]|nr:DegT/DnrJ/EryC1/StrS family aminotransferase [Desulfobacteraceae bacterium]
MKNSISELAICGGPPAFNETLHVGRPNIGDRSQLLQNFKQILDNRWLTNNGPFVQEFEAKIAHSLGVRHCIAMCNATIALEIVIRGLGLNGEVIVPSFTFIATAHSLQWQEITPVFCDIDPTTHAIDPKKVESLITPRTTGIIGVHLWGRPCAINELIEIANRHNLKLVFDAAHAFGCSHEGQMIGNFGEAEIFSFHATKFINAFEGGMVATNNDNLAAKLRLMKNFGFAGYDKVIHIGTNGKMNEMCAAMGISSLDSMDDFLQINQDNYRQYQAELAGIPGVSLIHYDENGKNNFQYIVLEIDEHLAEISRDQILRVLHAENIFARRYFYPGCHRMEPYRSYFPHAGLLLPETEKLAEKILVLPTGTSISPD